MPNDTQPKDAWFDCLQANEYRLTEPRKAVIKALVNSRQALNPTEIFDLAREEYPSLGLVSVYRTLETLEELNLIQRVHQPEGCKSYIAALSGHQHFLICKQCGRVAVFSGDDIQPLINRVEKTSGYKINEHWFQLFGLCQTCQSKKEAHL